jgi:hypothetical protein
MLTCGLMFSAMLIFMNLGKGSVDLWDEAITAGRSLLLSLSPCSSEYIRHSVTTVSYRTTGQMKKRCH